MLWMGTTTTYNSNVVCDSPCPVSMDWIYPLLSTSQCSSYLSAQFWVKYKTNCDFIARSREYSWSTFCQAVLRNKPHDLRDAKSPSFWPIYDGSGMMAILSVHSSRLNDVSDTVLPIQRYWGATTAANAVDQVPHKFVYPDRNWFWMPVSPSVSLMIWKSFSWRWRLGVSVLLAFVSTKFIHDAE